MSKGGSTRYIWKFVNGPVMEMACRQSLSLAVRFKSFRALLFIEQHMRLFLKESLDTGTDGLENAEDWLDAEDAEELLDWRPSTYCTAWEDISDTVEMLLLRTPGDPYNKFLQYSYCNIPGSCITAIIRHLALLLAGWLGGDCPPSHGGDEEVAHYSANTCPARIFGNDTSHQFISRILDGPSPIFTSPSLVNSTQQEDASRDNLPLFVSVRGYACEQKTSRLRLAIETARIHMARVLQRTIDRFIKRHYAGQHREPDRRLTASDVKVSLDPNFYTYGVFYNNCTFRMFASFPVLSRDANGRYHWMVRNIELEAFDYVQPMIQRQWGFVLSFMLTVEQHIHNLKEILGYL
ncbi:hypothetical protein C8Q72DRAFT_898601 [Fomitopsis betulina]|nr:hypothetical protein C8Q72DRAFT_898601 [Fomitopsis betulina]